MRNVSQNQLLFSQLSTGTRCVGAPKKRYKDVVTVRVMTGLQPQQIDWFGRERFAMASGPLRPKDGKRKRRDVKSGKLLKLLNSWQPPS